MLTEEQKAIMLISGLTVRKEFGYYYGEYNGKMSLAYQTEEGAWKNLWRVFTHDKDAFMLRGSHGDNG